MPNRVDETIKYPRRYQVRNASRGERDQWRRMVGCFGRQKLAGAWDGTLTALVGLRCGRAFAFETAIRNLLNWCSQRKAVERPDKQNDRNQAHHDMNATPHLFSGYQISEHRRTVNGHGRLLVVRSAPCTEVTWSRRACTSCDGIRYHIVVSSDLCPSSAVRTSKPVRSVREA